MMGIAVAPEEPLQLEGFGFTLVTDQRHAYFGPGRQADTTPDEGLQDQVCDLAFGPHQAAEVSACDTQQHTGDSRASAYQRWLVVQHVEFARELMVAEIDHGFTRVVYVAGVDVNVAFENNEHV